MRGRRNVLSTRDRQRAARAVGQRILRFPGLTGESKVAAYYATGGEISPHHALARRDINWYLPVLPPRRAAAMWFAPFETGTATRNNRYAIAEPVVPRCALRHARDMQFILTPLLAFDRRGGRLGMGGGYYDATLAFLHGRRCWQRPTVIGVAYAFQEVEHLPLEPWDVPLHGVVTEHEYIQCARR